MAEFDFDDYAAFMQAEVARRGVHHDEFTGYSRQMQVAMHNYLWQHKVDESALHAHRKAFPEKHSALVRQLQEANPLPKTSTIIAKRGASVSVDREKQDGPRRSFVDRFAPDENEHGRDSGYNER